MERIRKHTRRKDGELAKIERVRKADWKLGRKSSKCTVYSIRQGKRQKARQPL